MDNLRLVTDADAITTIWLDQPAKSVNTLSPAMLADLSQALDEAQVQHSAGVIFASAKSGSFIAGADLFAVKDAPAAELEEFLRKGQSLFTRIEALPVPTVAAINGDCLGGGLELALACLHRIAADDPSIKIGLPEVRLGIIPGWGGTFRLPRAIGLSPALRLMLTGKTLPPARALGAGLLDDVVMGESLMDAARRWLRQKRRRPAWSFGATSVRFIRNRILESARRETERKTHGQYPAPPRLIEVVREGYRNGQQVADDAARRAVLDLLQTDAGRNLMRLFFLRQGAKRVATAHLAATAKAVEYAVVVGGGTMGAGIVHALASAGVRVRLVEIDAPAVSAALLRVRNMLQADVRDGRLRELDARHVFNRISPTASWTGLGLADFAIEAVVERMDVKRDVFARLEHLVPNHAVLASNTSSLSIAGIAMAVKNRARVVGMHFFNPVPKMPLAEIVTAPDSDAAALATTVALAARLGKTPVIARDAPGFIVNRVLIPYLAEAMLLGREGVEVATIDTTMKTFGWPMGPFELLDEIGLDVAAEVLRTLGGEAPEYRPIDEMLAKAIERGWLGTKSGIGFYLHGKETGVNPEAIPPRRNAWRAILNWSPEQIEWRLMLPVINAAGQLLEEGVVDSSGAIDLATVLGLGFPPFRGGLACYIDTIGATEIRKRLEELQARYGRRFQPAQIWGRLAADHTALEKFALPAAPAEHPAPAISSPAS